MKLKMTVTGNAELARQMSRLATEVRGQALGRAVMAGALLIQNDAKERAPYRTGNLRRSIHSELESVGATSAMAKIGTDVEYARAIEYGTAARVIVPTNKKALYWPGADHPVRRVNHPGTPAKPFLRPAFDTKRDAASREIGDSLKAVLLRVAQ